LFSDRKIDAVKLHKHVQRKTTLSLDIAADAVEGGGQNAGGLSAHLDYAKPRLRVSPVDLAYLGGHIKGLKFCTSVLANAHIPDPFGSAQYRIRSAY